jgi:YesN/AraC family two-component response regulator
MLVPESFLELKNYIEDHYKDKLTLAGLAGKIHLAPAYLSRRFKEYFGVSPLNYAILLRLNNAALCLRNPQLGIKEVAELSGYADSLYFSRLFKKHMGKSPEKYREKLYSE